MSKANLPAPRLLPFISFFEKKMSEIQEEVESLRSLEPLYNTLRDALEAARLPHDRTITTSGKRVTCSFKVGNSHYREFEPLFEAITNGLTHLKLRSLDPPAVEQYLSRSYVWRIRRPQPKGAGDIYTLCIILEMGVKGNRYCTITERPYTYRGVNYEATWHDEPKATTTSTPKTEFSPLWWLAKDWDPT